MTAEPDHLQNFLDNASVSPEVFNLRPDYRALLLIIDGIIPGPSDSISETVLQQAESPARDQLAKQPITGMLHVAAWREAYKSFGSKPNRTRNSLEALIRRLEKPDGTLPRVNRMTDVYKAISVKHQIPLGGEDVRKYSGSPRLIRANGMETFELISSGEAVVEHPDAGAMMKASLVDAGTGGRSVPDEALAAAADKLVSSVKTFSPDIRVVSRVIGSSEKQ